MQQSWKIAFAYIGVIVGAGLSSGQDLLQYFISFGQIGLIGVLLLGLLNAAFGKIMLSLGSYYRADNHEEVFTQISHPIITKILDFVLIAGSFIMGFVMIAGAGSNLEQQFGLPFWVGGLICSLLIITVSFMDFDKITSVLGVFTPIMIVMIFIITGYSFIGKSHDWAALDTIAHTIKPATSNVWFSVINFANLDTVKDADLPILAIANQIHPWLAYIYAITVFSLIFNTAFSLFYSIARRFANGSTKRMRIVIISVVIIGYICSFFGFKDLISILYPILGYMGLLLLIILIYGWLRDRKDIIMEKLFRRKMLHLSLKKHSPHKNLSEKERELFHTLGDISQADTKSLEEHLSIDEEVIHQNINILQEQQEESKSTESSKDRPIKKSNINNNEVK